MYTDKAKVTANSKHLDSFQIHVIQSLSNSHSIGANNILYKIFKAEHIVRDKHPLPIPTVTTEYNPLAEGFYPMNFQYHQQQHEEFSQ